MAPKGKAADKGGAAKGKGKDKADEKEDKGGKVKPTQQINVRHILCEKHGKKEEALAKLKDGADFAAVAKEFSEDKPRAGGALGWKRRGDLDPAFETIAFDLAASTTANPTYAEVKTGFGYHIMMVEGRK